MNRSAKVILDSQHFDSKARQWDENPVFIERANRIAQALQDDIALTPAMTALDFGSGTGLLSFPLRDKLGHITLVDTSAGMIEIAREKIATQGVHNMTAIQANPDTAGNIASSAALPASLATDRFDLIYASMALHHIADTDAILATFHAHLKPGGWLGIADLDKEDGSFHGIEVDVHHGFDQTTLASQAVDAGFSEVRFQTVFEIVKEKPECVRAYPVFLMLARKN
jgi:ubiquinone/menaquinone biosynthesis C-methylase UbiE